MPFERFAILTKGGQTDIDGTLKAWARRLDYITSHMDNDNVSYAIGTDEIKETMIDLGLGVNQVNAASIPIADSTNWYTSTSVEGALAEVGSTIRNLASSNVNVDDTGGYYTATKVETVLQEIGNKFIGVWDDIRVPVTATQTGGAKQPGFSKLLDDGAGSQGVYTYMFDAGTEEELFFTVQVPHTYKEGTDLVPHVHWSPTSTASGNVVWGMEYTWANMSTSFPASVIIATTQATSVITAQHQLANLPTITGTNKSYSSMILCRLFRGSTWTGDTYPDDAALLEIDFHFIQDKLGTTSI